MDTSVVAESNLQPGPAAVADGQNNPSNTNPGGTSGTRSNDFQSTASSHLSSSPWSITQTAGFTSGDPINSPACHYMGTHGQCFQLQDVSKPCAYCRRHNYSNRKRDNMDTRSYQDWFQSNSKK